MHHVALDRPRPHDRDFDDEIVEALRLQPRQHRHLRAAFDLEHADRIGARQHVVDGRDRPAAAWRANNPCRNAACRRSSPRRRQLSMPSASTSTFIRPSVSMSSLSHSMKVRSSMAALPMGTVSSRRSAREHEAADMLRQMAREADQLVGKRDRLADRRIVRIEAGLADVIVRQAVAIAPHGLGQRRGDVLGQSQNLADFADGAARAVMHDGRADRRAMAAVAPVDVLDHLLAPLVLEIDVDIGRLAAVLGNEAGEQKLASCPDSTAVMPRQKHTALLAAEPRPWQRISLSCRARKRRRRGR